jgi:alkylation response protein AidB-like acyl-CoA dehydrogenase
MALVFSAEQEQLRQTVRQFLAEKSPEAEVRRLMDTRTGFDESVWRQMAEQLGLQSLTIPEQYGGAGYTYAELVIVFEEMGRALLCAPYLSSIGMATNLLLAIGDEEASADYLPGIAAGSIIATVALAEQPGRWDAGSVEMTAAGGPGEWKLSGTKLYVLDGHTADLVLAVARTPAGVSVFAVDKDAPGLSAQAVGVLDQTRKLARLDFKEVPARLVGPDADGAGAVAAMLDLAAVALAAEQVGGAQRALDMSVDYARTRHQFGRPIGSFQAVKHTCAQMLISVEAARSAAYSGGWAAAEHSADLPLAASLAKSYCSDAYFEVAAATIQVHGGIGFTWEHPAHLYFKRAKSSQLLFGHPRAHRERVATEIGI